MDAELNCSIQRKMTTTSWEGVSSDIWMGELNCFKREA